MDTGYGNPVNVVRTVEECVRLGAGGIILEDQLWPKKCGHMEGKTVIPMEEHVEKIRAAVYARGDDDLVIIGRTDARGPWACRTRSEEAAPTPRREPTWFSSRRPSQW